MYGDHVQLYPLKLKYFVIFMDDFSSDLGLFYENCSEIFSHFYFLCAESWTQLHTTVYTIRSDNAKDYVSESFQSYMRQHEILHQTSCIDIPLKNGVAERKNWHLLQTTWTLIILMKTPK